MMYEQKLIAAIKCNGRILREFKDTVYVNFGSEYTIYLKNLNSINALINITIDGRDIIPGGLVISPNQEIDLARSIEHGNLNQGTAFKFIERTEQIEDHRGIKADDGIIRIEFQWERLWQRQDGFQPVHAVGGWYPNYGQSTVAPSHSILRGVGAGDSSMMAAQSISCSSSAPTNDVGITVPGSVSDQRFQTVPAFPLAPEKHVIVLHLLGKIAGVVIGEPVTIKTKTKCTTCGKLNSTQSRFCPDCGTGLTIV